MTLEESDHMTATRLYQNNAKVHFNQHAESKGRFGKRLIYGGHIISLARAASFNGLANAFRVLAINGGRHVNPSFAGDTIYAWSEVMEVIELAGRVGPRRPAPAHHRHQGPPLRRFPGAGRSRQISGGGGARPRLHRPAAATAGMTNLHGCADCIH